MAKKHKEVISLDRPNKRGYGELRSVKIYPDYQVAPHGSVLIRMGATKVICAATIDDKVPHFLKNTGTGWLTAEYSLLPSASYPRNQREAIKGRQSGRTQEIQRLIGRSLRSVIDFKALGEKTIIVDCDVIQADGGTRTAAITGAFVAVVLACSRITPYQTFPVKDFVAAVSVGIGKNNIPVLDLEYVEDSEALVDMNIVMTASGELVEIQGTGEGRPFTKDERDQLFILAENGINQLIDIQKEVLEDVAWRVGSRDNS